MDELSFTDGHVRRIAAPGSYERGLDYLHAVANLRLITGQATATVHGTAPYAVTLTTRPRLAGWCTCPHGADGNFCKHCVAVALTLLDLGSMSRLLARSAQADDLIEVWLDGLSREQLHGLLIEILSTDPGLRDRLATRAATSVGDSAAIRASAAGLLNAGVPHDDVPRYLGQIWEIVRQADTMVSDGRASVAVPVLQEAIEALSTAWSSLGDESPRFVTVMATLTHLHETACLAAPPEPAALARWLLEHASLVEPLDYLGILGEPGIAVLREDPDLLPSLLAALGEVDELVALQAADLAPDGSTHSAIAAELDTVGRHHEAVDWAEQGIRHAGQYPAPPDLVDLVCDDYGRHGRSADAAGLRRAEFEKSPTLETFGAYRGAAITAGTWVAERSHALEAFGGGERYIDALIADEDIDTALIQAPAHASVAQRLRLADLIAASRPADALPVYHSRAQDLRAGTGAPLYRALVDVLVKMRSCHELLGSSAEFDRYLAAVRADAKRKRTLISMMDAEAL